ncbi:MAG: TonB-dependent receptor [Acidobacteria bacterium]|nr:MAG: TonB-dependent receptor [Acidobacteriota bacterium]
MAEFFKGFSLNRILEGKMKLLGILLFNLLAFSIIGLSQSLDLVTIQGKVTDSNGAVLPGATITATFVATGNSRSVATNAEGEYKIIDLQPGAYSVTAEMKGFEKVTFTEIYTISGQNVRLDFTLNPAAVTAEQTIKIEAGGEEALGIDTTRTVVGGTLIEREVEELPNNSRNPLDLVLILGGVTEEPLSTRDLSQDRGLRGIAPPGTTPEEAGIFALSGGAAYSNNITIDGFDNNDDRAATFRFQPSIESVAEVQVITNQFSAEYGRASGGRVNIRTRAGGNRYRGRIFYFFRDDNLNANTWNNNRRGIERPKFTDHNPGLTFGGPIIKRKFFFFTSYEYQNIQEDTIIDAWVPLNNQNSRFRLPAPTNPERAVTVTAAGQSVQVAPYIAPFDTPLKKHILSARTDWNLNDSNNFTFSYQLGRLNDLRQFSGTNRIADSLVGRIRNTQAFNFTHNYIVSSKITNQFRFQYSTLKPKSAQNAGESAPAVLVTFTPPGESSQTQVFGSTSNSSDRKESRWQFQNTLSYVAGKHLIRIGADIHRVKTLFIDRFDATGTYSFSNFVFFNINSVSRYVHNYNTSSEIKNNYYGIFVQDDWRVRSNVTIGLGLRYERETVLDDNNNFGPRFAIAWNPFPKESKTVVRFGAGIFYNRVLLRTVDDFTSGKNRLRLDTNSLNVPPGVTVDLNVVRSFLSSQFPNPLTLDTQIPVNSTQSFSVRQLTRPVNVFRSLSPDLKIPESYQLNLGFERELVKGIIFETNLTYNKTAHLWREYNPNAPVLPANTPDRDGDGRITFTDYLLGINSGISLFELGSPNDPTGLRAVGGGTCTSSTQTCVVNLRTTNSNANCSTTSVTNNPICRAFAAINPLRPFFSTLGAVQLEQVIPVGNSRYLGAVMEIRTRYKKFPYGFAGAFRFVYTLSSLKDDGIVNTSEATVPADFSREWSRSLLDRRHRISVFGTIDLPRWLGKIRISPLFRFGSSAPFNVSAGGIDRNLDDINNDRPNFDGDLSTIKWRKFGSAFPSDLASRFSLAPIGSPGNLPRNAGKGPRLYLLDLRISRQFKFGDRMRFRPSIELDNIFNMTVFSFGSNFINFDLLNSQDPATITRAREAFLAPTRTYRPRQIRLGFRFEF